MNTLFRRPTAYPWNDPNVVVTDADKEASTEVFADTPERDVVLPAVPTTEAISRSRSRFGWATVFWSALGGLIALGIGLAITQLVQKLYAHNQVLGWIGLSFTATAALALSVILMRDSSVGATFSDGGTARPRKCHHCERPGGPRGSRSPARFYTSPAILRYSHAPVRSLRSMSMTSSTEPTWCASPNAV